MTDDLDVGASVLAPVRRDRSQMLGRWLIGPLTGLLLALVLVFYVWYSPSTVNGDSMLPTLHHRDRLLVTKGFDTLARGDVVVFSWLNTRTGETEGLIKRVMAVAGDTIEVRGDLAIVNGVREVPANVLVNPADPAETDAYVVPPDTVFVLGDNRPVALDSRQLGPIRLSAVEGKVEWIWSPIWRIRRVR